MVSVLDERARYSLSWLKERLYTWAHRFTPRLHYTQLIYSSVVDPDPVGGFWTVNCRTVLRNRKWQILGKWYTLLFD